MEPVKLKRYIFVTGGVASGIGKGTIASSIGLLLQSHRKISGPKCRVSAIKIDPYLNKTAGNMSPHEHGEVYVLSDGTETDLDLGNYERFMDIDLVAAHSITTGQVYAEVIEREQRGEYLGKTVQIVPHITDHIIERIEKASVIPVRDSDGVLGVPDVVIIELGGTVGDMESEPFLHAISRFALLHRNDVCVLHVGLLVSNNGEYKTKPLQHSIQAMRARGVFPDVLCVRCDYDGEPPGIKSKLSFACHFPAENVVFSGRVKTIYEVPRLLHSQYIEALISRRLSLTLVDSDLTKYQRVVDYFSMIESLPKIRVNIIAKYSGPDTYLSLSRALEHAAISLGFALDVKFISAESSGSPESDACDGIIIPGGFGDRGIEGKIKAITNARFTGVPVLGLCLGLQLLAIEESRTMLGRAEANSTEFDPNTPYPVVEKLPQANMRLGLHQVHLSGPAVELYGGVAQSVHERHRHRYHVKTPALAESSVCGVSIGSGASYVTDLMFFSKGDDGPNESEDEADKQPEVEEWLTFWRAIGVQYHPEYLSRNNRPHPLFVAFLRRCAVVSVPK